MLNATILPAGDEKNPAPEIFTDETAAAYIGGIKARAVRDWRTKRGLPFIRVTAKVCRIRKTDLDKWLASCRVAITKGAA
jgi:excisionase family DNA binding protein